jgi:hypothetical protein
MRVIVVRDTNAKTNRHPGLNISGGFDLSGVSECGIDDCCKLVSVIVTSWGGVIREYIETVKLRYEGKRSSSYQEQVLCLAVMESE